MSDHTINTVTVSFTTGQFNMLSKELHDQIVLRTPEGTVSTLWPTGTVEYTPDLLPSEVAVLIRERIKYYAVYNGRDGDLDVIWRILNNARIIDSTWLIERAARLRRRAEVLIREAAACDMRARDILEGESNPPEIQS